MKAVWRSTWLTLGLATFASLIGACDPEPHFATPENLVPGSIVTEKSLVTTGADQQLGLLYRPEIDGNRGGYRIRVTIPADAYPAGTRVTVRLLANLQRKLDEFTALYEFTQYRDYVSALQILSAGRDPERPLRIAFIEVEPEAGIYLLLHAREGDQDWSVVSMLDAPNPPPAFQVTRAGLWTTVSELPKVLLGKLKRISLECDWRPVTNPAPVLLDLSKGVYTATTIDAQGCRITRTAPTIYRDNQTCFELATEVCPRLDYSELTFIWTGESDECAAGSTVYERYQLLNADSPEVLPPEPAECQTQEGALPDVVRE